MKSQLRILAALLASAAFAASTNAAIVVLVQQDFDSVGTAGTTPPTNWTIGGLGGTHNNVTDGGGAITPSALVPDNGSNGVATGTGGTIGRSYNYGITGAHADTDRALGNIPTTGSGDRAIQVAITNTTGAPITEMYIAYTGEQWRLGQGSSDSGVEKLRFYYSTSADSGWTSVGLDWTAPVQAGADFVPLDGNNSLYRNELSTTFSLPAPLADGATFYLRWLDWNDHATNDSALAIDDVTVSVEVAEVPEPASLSILAVSTLALFRRRRS